MPCNSDYMEASSYERKISQVACLLDELAGKSWSRDDWSGYHPRVYNKAVKGLGDTLVKELCTALKEVDVTQYSLEMQMWWRDHQVKDKERINREAIDTKRQAALAKLTPHERQLLNL